MKLSKKIAIGASACLVVLSLTACNGTSNQANNGSSNTATTTKVANASSNPSELAKLNYKPGTNAWTNVNHDKSTLNPKSWKYDHVIYSNLDKENRTSAGNTGYLDKDNVANDSLRVRQTVQPTGWHQKFINREAILNRGHEIAYSMSKGIGQNGQYDPSATSGDQNNPKNLFTQTAFSNQKTQTIYEAKVRNAIKQGKKVIYQVKPIFQGNDKMAKGVQMQAVSTDGTLNFNVYLFNVQPHMQFDYQTGTSKVDNNMNVPTPKNAPTFKNDNKGSSYNSSYNRGYYPRRRNHHFVRHAVEGYALYRLGKHVQKRHYERHYYEPSHHYYEPHTTTHHSLFGGGSHFHSSFHSHHRL